MKTCLLYMLIANVLSILNKDDYELNSIFKNYNFVNNTTNVTETLSFRVIDLSVKTIFYEIPILKYDRYDYSNFKIFSNACDIEGFIIYDKEYFIQLEIKLIPYLTSFDITLSFIVNEFIKMDSYKAKNYISIPVNILNNTDVSINVKANIAGFNNTNLTLTYETSNDDNINYFTYSEGYFLPQNKKHINKTSNDILSYTFFTNKKITNDDFLELKASFPFLIEGKIYSNVNLIYEIVLLSKEIIYIFLILIISVYLFYLINKVEINNSLMEIIKKDFVASKDDILENNFENIEEEQLQLYLKS